MPDLKLVEFVNPVDIPAGLRRMADSIEAGEFPDLRFIVAVCVEKNAAFTAYSWGTVSTLEAIGALARAVSRDLVDETSAPVRHV